MRAKFNPKNRLARLLPYTDEQIAWRKKSKMIVANLSKRKDAPKLVRSELPYED